MTAFISPMLAAPMPKKGDLLIRPDEWRAEVKIDGHRLIVVVSESGIAAFSRHGLPRSLPTHLTLAFGALPFGTYDGELHAPGERSYGVTEIVNSDRLVYTVFDVLECDGPTVGLTYQTRRSLLERVHLIYAMGRETAFLPIQLATSVAVRSLDHVTDLLNDVWRTDGEGLILKRVDAIYTPGKRPKDAWIKRKALRTAVLTVVGFIASRGEKQNRGPYGTVLLRDEAGKTATVKTLNDAELAAFQAEERLGSGHPAIGRRLRIEYQEKTPDGMYRHPRWDRWED